MAPLLPRQFHSFSPAPPGPPKGPSTKPVPVTKSINPVVFVELFAGTVGIFVFAVLFWKIGRCVRSFNRHKVLGPGKPQTARYARTWYGWVSLGTHQRNKRAIRNCFARMRRWTAWRSSRADYRWVWWDPGHKEFHKRQQDRRLLVRWLPKCFRSFDFTAADDIWNPGASPECHGALLNTSPERPSAPPTGSPRGQEVAHPMPKRQFHLSRRRSTKRRRVCQEVFRTPTGTSDGAFECLQGTALPNATTLTRYPQPSSDESLMTLSSSMHQLHLSQSIGSRSIPGAYRFISRRRDLDELHCGHVRFEITNAYHGRRRNDKGSMRRDDQTFHRRRCYTRTYRVWSTKMQLQAANGLKDLRESSGPPGTPATELLLSCASEQIDAAHVHHLPQRESHSGNACGPSFHVWRIPTKLGFGSGQRDCFAATKWNSAPVRFHSAGSACFLEVAPTRIHGWQSLRASTAATLPNARTVASLQERTRSATRASQCLSDPASRTRSIMDLSDWEVRLVDRLDRKLVWLFNEFTPGQKPYHFALLANHWLNRETWIVIDPVSRVPIDARRQWGDPRLNVPYPEPQPSRKPKYPAVTQTPARIPRIDSWRAAINKQRRASGVRERIRTVQHFNESADEAPDGQIDPACWILPKPPQGFEMSTKQKNAWYEGGAGWQENLEDWQQVRWGYRVRKAIHEGRVNRTRVKELATQINRCCRSTSLKLMPNRAAGQGLCQTTSPRLRDPTPLG